MLWKCTKNKKNERKEQNHKMAADAGTSQQTIRQTYKNPEMQIFCTSNGGRTREVEREGGKCLKQFVLHMPAHTHTHTHTKTKENYPISWQNSALAFFRKSYKRLCSEQKYAAIKLNESVSFRHFLFSTQPLARPL